MSSIQFSVIIPLYNKEIYILRALNSVLSQTYAEFECIIIDDGSTDNSLALVSGIKDTRLVVLSKPNEGVSSARNLGIETAKNDFIAFLDADDFWEISFLESICLLVNERPGHSLYFTSHYKLDKNGNKTLIYDNELALDNCSASFDLFDYFQTKRRYLLPIHTSSTVIRKSALLRAGCFDKRISFFEDYALFSRLALDSKFVYLNEPLSTYDGSLPANKRITGKLPVFENHWVNYIYDGKLSKIDRYKVRFFQANFAVWLMNSYRKIGVKPSGMKNVRKKVNFTLLTLKNRILYLAPSFILKLIFRR
jgi:glycosyltransferase involved in cell wall biosynthesis